MAVGESDVEPYMVVAGQRVESQIEIDSHTLAAQFRLECLHVPFEKGVVDKDDLASSRHPEADLIERFFRASTSAGIAGTRIGLDVVKSFVEMHGGSIAVESGENDGTRFTVRLPIGGGADTASGSEAKALFDELIDIDERLFSDA